MNSIQQIAAFAETAKHGSFAAAGREMGMDPSTLAKAVGRFEQSLGVRLFHRTTRQVSLTADGERLFERCQRLLQEADALQADAMGVRSEPAGTLRVALPIVLGKRWLLPVLAGLAQRHPGLAVDLRLQDGYADLVRDGLDVGVRVGALKDSSLVSKRVASQEMLLVASPGYLAGRGTPKRLDQLAAHDAVLFRLPSSGRDRPWSFRRAGRAVEVQPASRVRLDDGEGMVAAARLGLGLAQLPHYFVSDELRRGDLVEVLKPMRPAALPISVVYPAARLVPLRVRVFVEALSALEGP